MNLSRSTATYYVDVKATNNKKERQQQQPKKNQSLYTIYKVRTARISCVLSNWCRIGEPLFYLVRVSGRLQFFSQFYGKWRDNYDVNLPVLNEWKITKFLPTTATLAIFVVCFLKTFSEDKKIKSSHLSYTFYCSHSNLNKSFTLNCVWKCPNQIRLFGSPRYSWCFRY